MKITLTNGEVFTVGRYVTLCSMTSGSHFTSNQCAITRGVSVNQNCNLLENWQSPTPVGDLLKLGDKLIPLKSICYISK